MLYIDDNKIISDGALVAITLMIAESRPEGKDAQFYRFTSPKSKEYPYMIETFSRNPYFIIL